MGLFDKKYCDICGEKIGLLGNRKLEDGNLCKDCAGKLSYWFDDRRHSTVDDIKAQLAYREENRAQVEAFNITCTFGQNTLLCLDEDKNKFMVCRTSNRFAENPDVLDYAQVTGCDLDIEEYKTEEMREVKDREGIKRISYNPPRYEYSYDFYIRIRVNHPYFDEIRFKLNRSTIEMHNIGSMNVPTMHRNQNTDIAGSILWGLNAALNQSAGAQPTDPRMQNPNYAECYEMGQEIKAALAQIRTQVRENIEAANAPRAAAVCPACGATTVPDASGCCEYCGSPLH